MCTSVYKLPLIPLLWPGDWKGASRWAGWRETQASMDRGIDVEPQGGGGEKRNGNLCSLWGGRQEGRMIRGRAKCRFGICYEMQPPDGSVMEEWDWGRFMGAETVAGWRTFFSNSIVILFITTTKKPKHFVFTAQQDVFSTISVATSFRVVWK